MSDEKQNVTLLTYQELLGILENSDSNHLLLGNGFNNSLGIRTSYYEIFLKMKEQYSGYKNIEEKIEKECFDIEKLIGGLKQKVQSDEDHFLESYIETKIKIDFMKATNEIVRESIKKVYQDNNKGIHFLLKKFTRYFTLNYDPFLYLMLLNFKMDKSGEGSALVMEETDSYQKHHLNKTQNNIYTAIQDLRESGRIDLTSSIQNSNMDLRNMQKTHFQAIVKGHNRSKNKGWKSGDIDKVCNKIWNDEKKKSVLEVNDGFQKDLFQCGESQNLYFLHGGFHIEESGGRIRKITAKKNKSFVEKLEKAIHAEHEGIVCVLAFDSKDKKTQIEESKYLRKCFDDLSKISGSLVVFGSSLSENDQHVFDQINKSDISKIYISSCLEESEKDYRRAHNRFKKKEIVLFDYKSVSYRDES